MGMPKIQILPDVLASQVAAGEVVERPASVVKEMVENAIDAGAKHIEVEIHKGGASLIKITDDGCGMAKEDALLSLERHATSKLKSVDQLAAISTMGFRGEAVPSVASISKLRLSTREHDSVEGTEINVDGGVVKDVRVAGMQPGTVFEIRNLFFNVPARKKFMRAESTESAHVEHQVRLHALAYPQVRFTFKKDARVVFDVPATHDHRSRIAGLSGNEVGRALIEVPYVEMSGMEVQGFVLPAKFARKGRRQQFVFLNGRPVEDAAISRAIKDGFKGAVADGLNPTAWLWITMPPMLVDVNVHPAKKEVRFHRPYDVRNLVMTAVEEGMRQKNEASNQSNKSNQVVRGEAKIVSRKTGTQAPVRKPFETETVTEATTEQTQPITEEKTNTTEKASTGSAVAEKVITNDEPTTPSFPAPKPQQEELEIEEKNRPLLDPIGLLHGKYVLLQGEDGLVLLDPKAGRERVVYEQVIASGESGKVEEQGLLVPEVLELDARDYDVILLNVDNFREAGISLEPFGGSSFQVRSLPSVLQVENPREFITKLIDELIETQGGKRGKQMAFELFAEAIAARAGRCEKCDLKTAPMLLEEMFQCDLPYCTPSGKPTLIQISMKELERKFKG